jgi:AAA+ superfamily predicted ATPase
MEFDLSVNIRNILSDLEWVKTIARTRVDRYLAQIPFSITEIDLPALSDEHSTYAAFVQQQHLQAPERLLLALSLLPDLDRSFLSSLLKKEMPISLLSLLDLVQVESRSVVQPTANTALFFLAGDSAIEKVRYESMFQDHSLFTRNILCLQSEQGDTILPWQHKVLSLEQDYRDWLVKGAYSKPVFSTDFPAEEITTRLNEDDLVLAFDTRQGLEQMMQWLKHKEKLFHIPEYARKVKPGARALFHGDPGTGKTESAAMLGRMTGRTVFKIDLSKVISKYIGETEKNLGRLFDKAQHKGWILFFDEGDALFGKRTEHVESSNDLHANQQIAYLLQRIETFDGLVILSTNFKNNIDAAFFRRFDMVVAFHKPQGEDLVKVWEQVFPEDYALDKDIDWAAIASHKAYGFSPAQITNIMKFVLLRLEQEGSRRITQDHIFAGIHNELHKNGVPFSMPALKRTEPEVVEIKTEFMPSTSDIPVTKDTSLLSPPGFDAASIQRMSPEELGEAMKWFIQHQHHIRYNTLFEQILMLRTQRNEEIYNKANFR